MKLTEKGQVTIPIDIRERLQLRPGDEVDFTVDGDTVRLARAATVRRGRRIVSQLLGSGDTPLSTDEIMALTRETTR